jgi:membrane fusion protein, multidrug efflux system
MFRIELTPQWLNRPHLRFGVAVLLLSLLLMPLGCNKDEEPAPAQTGQQRPSAGGGPSSEKQPIPIAVAIVARGDIASYYRATATLEAEKQADVLSRVTGLVESIAVEEGHLVQVGDPLLQIANDEYRLRLQQAEAKSANLRARFERLKSMHSEQLTTDEDFQAARADLASAEADEGLARLNFSYTTVTAPFTGRVISRLVESGQNVSNGTAMFTIADFDPLLARIHVPSREFNKLRQDQIVDLALDSDGRMLEGKITLISPVIDPASGTIKVTVKVSDYPVGTRPGDFAEVRVVTEQHLDTILVPRTAVITEKGEKVVYLAVDNTAERRNVEIGFSDDDSIEITAGLEAGELVIVKGQRSLKHGEPIKILHGRDTDEKASPPVSHGGGHR